MSQEYMLSQILQQIPVVGDQALDHFKTIGDLASAFNSIKDLGKYLFIKSAADELENVDKITPDFGRVGKDLLEELAERGSGKSDFCKSYYKNAIKNALDPEFSSPEIRKEDLDLLQTFDGSDFVVCMTVEKYTDLMIQDWERNNECSKLLIVFKKYDGAYTSVRNLYPQDLLIKYAKLEYPGLKLSEDDLMYTVTQRLRKSGNDQKGLYSYDKFNQTAAWVNTVDSNDKNNLSVDALIKDGKVSGDVIGSLMRIHLSPNAKRVARIIKR